LKLGLSGPLAEPEGHDPSKRYTREEVQAALSVPLRESWEDIPKQMQKKDTWMALLVFPTRGKDGTLKWNKVPWNLDSWRALKWRGGDALMSYEAAKKAVIRSQRKDRWNRHIRLARVFQPDEDIVGIDLDHCVEPDGTINDAAIDVINEFASFTEFSPSGNGIHIFLHADSLGIQNHKFSPIGVEVFRKHCLMTVTGRMVPGSMPYSEVKGNGARLREMIKIWKEVSGVEDVKRLTRSSLRNLTDQGMQFVLSELTPYLTGRETRKDFQGQEATFWNMECPWAAEHTTGRDNASDLIRLDSGDIIYKCFHSSCRFRGYGSLAYRFDLPSGNYIDQLNDQLAIVGRGVKNAFVVTHGPKSPGIQVQHEIKEKKSLEDWYENKTVETYEGKQVSQFKMWMKSEDRRELKHCTFLDPRPDSFDFWTGWNVAPKPGDWGMYRKHWENVMCNGNKELSEYVFDWIARMIQDPGGKRPGTVLVFRSREKGIGKGEALRWVLDIAGTHGVRISKAEKVVGRFNSLLAAKILLVAEEAFFAGDPRNASTLKALVTEDTYSIEYKFQDAVDEPNKLNIIMATNEDWAIPAETDSRRWCVIDCNPKMKGNFKYFRALENHMLSGGLAAFMDAMSVRPYDIDRLRSAPRTEALEQQEAYGRDHFEQMVANWCAEGEIFWGDSPDQALPLGALISSRMIGAAYDYAYQKARPRSPQLGRNILYRRLEDCNILKGYRLESTNTEGYEIVHNPVRRAKGISAFYVPPEKEIKI